MTDPRKKDMATSFTFFLFIVLGVSGILMFFHVFDDYLETVHEILGLAFVLASSFHILYNWKQMKRYFSKTIFLISGILIFFISLMLGFLGEDQDPRDVIIESLLNTPISISFVVLSNNYEKTKTKLEEMGIVINGSTTIEEISKNNGISQRQIVEAIMH